MSETRPTSGAKSTREERLAAKLRENLRRRKNQARAQNEGPAAGINPADLPKVPPSR